MQPSSPVKYAAAEDEDDGLPSIYYTWIKRNLPAHVISRYGLLLRSICQSLHIVVRRCKRCCCCFVNLLNAVIIVLVVTGVRVMGLH